MIKKVSMVEKVRMMSEKKSEHGGKKKENDE